MLVISDSSPLIALAQCEKLDLLDLLFEKTVIPAKVFEETQVIAGAVADTIAAWASGNVMSVTGKNLEKAQTFALDPGETEAIALYWDTNADFLLIDETEGRQAAAAAGINITGTIGILILAKQRSMIPAVKPLLDVLRKHDFYVSDDLYRRVLTITKEL